MSMSDSDLSSYGSYGGAEYKNFRQITRDRLLYEMLRSIKAKKDSKATWKVLIMDKLTVKIMSNSCKMADITDEGVSLVEDLYKRRQPMPAMDAIYFMQPIKENITMFLSDMSGRNPLYKKAYVFFSSPVSRELVSHIKNDSTVLPRIGALSEMNLEYFAIDSQGFVTDHERALEELFAEDAENSRKYNTCLNTMASRIATVFASLREFPYVRYRAAKSSLDASTMTTLRDLVPTKLAAGVWNCLARYKTTIPDFPQRETCELLIVDRSVDQIAPIIHEWTYDAMCHDLLNLEGNKYVHEVSSKSGAVEKKEVLLEDHDPIWLELRHAHIADASERLHEKMTNFISRNKAAQIHHNSRENGDLSTRDLQKMVQALPHYSEQIDKLSLHVEVLETLKGYGVEQIEDILLPDDPKNEGKIRGFAFLEFKSHSDAMAAFQRLRRPDALFGRNISAKVAFAQTPLHPCEEDLLKVKTVYMEGIPKSWDESKVEELCKQYGEIEKIQLSKNFTSSKRKDFGFVEFFSRDGAVACVEGVNNTQFDEDVNVKAHLARPIYKGRLAKQIRGGYKIQKNVEATEEPGKSKKKKKAKYKAVHDKKETQPNLRSSNNNIPSKSQDKNLKEKKTSQTVQSVKGQKRGRKGTDIAVNQHPPKKVRKTHTYVRGRGRHSTGFSNPRSSYSSNPYVPRRTTYAPPAASYTVRAYSGASGSQHRRADLEPHAGYLPAANHVHRPYVSDMRSRSGAYGFQPRSSSGYIGGFLCIS